MCDGEKFLAEMWWSASPLVKYTLMVLMSMFLWTLLTGIERGEKYGAAVWQSRRFSKASVGLLENGDWDGVLALAEAWKRSPVANVFASGLREFRRARECVSAELSIEVANRGARTAMNRAHKQLSRGLGGLGTIATTAPLVGVFGTVIGILDSFRGVGMERSTYIALTAQWLAQARASFSLHCNRSARSGPNGMVFQLAARPSFFV